MNQTTPDKPAVKHTPGEWHALKYPDVKTWTVAGECSVASKIKSESDARLIAAAPELLEALQDLLDCPDLNLDSLEPATMEAIQHTRSAIDKATGRC